MRRALAVLALTLVSTAPVSAQRVRADSAFLAQLRWRSIGPANMGGRVSDLEANHLNPKVIYAAFATGGLWKTVNAGTTWTPIFDATGVHAVSEVTIAPSDTSIIWAGTGEEDSRNSISPGAGVFKSVDAGRTWTYMGLRETQHVGTILIHPTNPNIVFVSALGRTWGRNPERGVYRTTDGGQNWTRVLTVGDRAGAVDMTMDPTNPDILIAAMWERQRGPYFLQSGGPGSGLWRTTDGGNTWRRLTGNGLPTTTLGRIGVAFARSNPRIVYAIVEADSNPNPASLRRGFVPDTSQRQRLQSGLFRSMDGGTSWERMNSENNRPFYYSRLWTDPRNENRVYWLSTQMRYSNDGGRSWRRVGAGIHVDYHALWINPADPDHYIVGQDGGIAQTFDRGRTYDAILQMAVGQFYAVGVDMQRPFWVCGGLQDNGTWCGPSQNREGGITNAHWVNINGGDGFYAAIDPTDPDIVYAESQGGNVNRLDMRTWERRGIRPGGSQFGQRMLEDSILIARGDTTVAPSPQQQRAVDSLRARQRADSIARPRFNWSTPFFLSSHNPSTIYVGANRLYKSVNRGDTYQPISDDLSTRDTMRIRISMRATGGITLDATGAETHGTITSISESPRRAGIIWAGTDDGNVWLTTNDGGTWTSLTGRFPGVPARTWVSRVEASPHDSMTAYVTFDGHREDNFRPYVFVTTDYGRTFRSISANLPANEYVHVVRENPRRRGMLFVGTELAAYVSTDAGESWQRLMNGMPPVPVHDLVVHPRDRQLVAGTHGRSIFVMDIGALEELTDSILTAPFHLFAVEPGLLFSPRVSGGGVGAVGSKVFVAQNPPSGVRIAFRVAGPERPAAPGIAAGGIAEGEEGGMAQLAAMMGFGGGGGGGGQFGGGAGARAPRPDDIVFVITDATGDTIRTLRAPAGGGALRTIQWDMRRERGPLGPSARRDSIRLAQRQAQLRDSIMGAMRADTAGGRRPGPGGMMAGMPGRDPQPGEPGVYEPPQAAAGIAGLAALFGGGGGGGFGGFGGGAGAFVEPGTYLVTVSFSGVQHRQTIRVERPDQRSAPSGGWR